MVYSVLFCWKTLDRADFENLRMNDRVLLSLPIQFQVPGHDQGWFPTDTVAWSKQRRTMIDERNLFDFFLADVLPRWGGNFLTWRSYTQACMLVNWWQNDAKHVIQVPLQEFRRFAVQARQRHDIVLFATPHWSNYRGGMFVGEVNTDKLTWRHTWTTWSWIVIMSLLRWCMGRRRWWWWC